MSIAIAARPVSSRVNAAKAGNSRTVSVPVCRSLIAATQPPRQPSTPQTICLIGGEFIRRAELSYAIAARGSKAASRCAPLGALDSGGAYAGHATHGDALHCDADGAR